jgi:hypothetical protein
MLGGRREGVTDLPPAVSHQPTIVDAPPVTSPSDGEMDMFASDDESGILDASVDDQVLEQVRHVLESYRKAPAGRISRVDAWANIEFLRNNTAALREEMGYLLSSPDESDRILGVFLHLEILDEKALILQRTINDPSFYVRSEVAAWLYEHGQLDDLRRYAAAISDNLHDAHRHELRDLMDKNPPIMDVPAGLAALNIGESLPVLFREVVRHNGRLRDDFLESVRAGQIRVDQLSRTLDTFAFLPLKNHRAILIDFLENSEDLQLARYAIVRRLAALTDDSDTATQQIIRHALPPDANDDLPTIEYRAAYTRRLADLEDTIRQAPAGRDFTHLFTDQVLARYRNDLLLSPKHIPARDVVASIERIDIPRMHRETQRMLMDIIFIYHTRTLNKETQ